MDELEINKLQQIFADPRSIVNDFHGNEDPQKAKAWIEDFQNTKMAHDWSDVVAISILKSKMRDSALKWFMMFVFEIKFISQ